MKAVVIHHNFNSPGGERIVAIETIQSLAELGYEIDLVTVQRPNLEDLAGTTYGKKIAVTKIRSLFPAKINYFGIYQRLLSTLQTLGLKDSDMVINTSGFVLPYKLPRSIPSMIYIHGPTLILDSDYQKYSKYGTSLFWSAYIKPYKILANMLERTAISRANIILANSKFTRDSITKAYTGAKPSILYPPVDIERFSRAYSCSSRKPEVLVVSRFSPEKQIEKIIQIARLVDNNIVFRIFGSLLPANRQYFNSLSKMVNLHRLENRVNLIPNASSDEIVCSMSTSRVYLHAAFGEPFGISIIEAMAAGLVPVIPSIGGCSEIVPFNHLYTNIQEASVLICKNIIEYDSKIRNRFHSIATEFSQSKFREKFKGFVSSLIA